MIRFVFKTVYWLCALATLLLAVVVAVSNRHPVPLSFDPLPIEATPPLYVVIFGSVLIGLLIGAATGLLSAARRRRKRQKTMEGKTGGTGSDITTA